MIFIGKQDEGGKQVVPTTDKRKNSLGRYGRFHDGQNNPIEGRELAGTVYTRRIHDLKGQRGKKILTHKEHHRGRGYRRQYQG
jgi:hypothetical protein